MTAAFAASVRFKCSPPWPTNFKPAVQMRTVICGDVATLLLATPVLTRGPAAKAATADVAGGGGGGDDDNAASEAARPGGGALARTTCACSPSPLDPARGWAGTGGALIMKWRVGKSGGARASSTAEAAGAVGEPTLDPACGWTATGGALTWLIGGAQTAAADAASGAAAEPLLDPACCWAGAGGGALA